jgi:hypothetical protein
MKFGIRNSKLGIAVAGLFLLAACTDYVAEYKDNYEDAYGD